MYISAIDSTMDREVQYIVLALVNKFVGSFANFIGNNRSEYRSGYSENSRKNSMIIFTLNLFNRFLFIYFLWQFKSSYTELHIEYCFGILLIYKWKENALSKYSTRFINFKLTVTVYNTSVSYNRAQYYTQTHANYMYFNKIHIDKSISDLLTHNTDKLPNILEVSTLFLTF